MRIHQFSMIYSPLEDRIVFRLNTLEKEEFKFFLTRRYVKLLWPLLMKMLENDIIQREPEHQHFAGEMLNFEHENIISRSDFGRKYEESSEQFPLGTETILLARIQVKKGPQSDILCLLPEKGKGIELGVNQTFLHTFCKLLKDTVKKADWDLGAEMWMRESPPPSKRVLH